jgi:hypothetical protein
MGKENRFVYSLFTIIDIEHDDDDEQEDRFEEREVAEVEASCFVMSVLVDDQCGDDERSGEPDSLTFCVPHEIDRKQRCAPRSSRLDSGLQPGEPFGGRPKRRVLLTETESHLLRAALREAVKA